MASLAPHQFSLANLASCRSELRYAYRGLVPTRGGTGRYSPAWFSCWLIEAGWGEVMFADGRRGHAQEGQWLLSPPYLPRDQSFSRDASIISVAFSLPLPQGIDPQRVLPRVVEDGDAVARLQKAAVAMLAVLNDSAAPDQGARRCLEGLDLASWLRAQEHLAAFVAQWHAAWGEVEPAPAPVLDARVQAARTLIGAAARMGAVPYAHVQERTGLSRAHLDRLFRSQLGHSPKEELDRRVLERVLRRLADPLKPLKAIAHELGFADSSHLCRWFRQRTGQSPERYRRAVPT